MFPNDFESKFTFENASDTPISDDQPFNMLILSDWSGDSGGKDLVERRSIEIDRDNFDDILRKCNVTVDLDLYGDENTLLRIQIESFDDFHPDNLFRNISLFSDLRDLRRRLSNSDTFETAAQEVRSWFANSDEYSEDTEIQSQIDDAPPIESNNLLDLILDQPSVPIASVKLQPTENTELKKFVSKLVQPYLIEIDEAEQSKLLSVVDEAISELMRAILHHTKFQALESAWRALYFLVRRVETDSSLKIFIFDVTHQELLDNLKSVKNLTDSFLHQLLVSGSYAIIAGNYSFGLNVDDVSLLMRLSQLAYNFDVSFLSYIKPQIFGFETFIEVKDVSNLDFIEDSREAKLWQALCSIPESSYVGLSPMRILGRLPYGDMTDSIETFSFEEFNENTDFNKFLWLNPCFVIALLLAQSYKFSGSQMGENLFQEIDNLPMYIYREDGEAKTLPCAEVALTEKLLEKMLAHGLMSLISFRDSQRVRLARYQSISSDNGKLLGKWVF